MGIGEQYELEKTGRIESEGPRLTEQELESRVANLRRSAEILPNAAKVMGVEPERVEWTVDPADTREHVTDGSPCWCGPTTLPADGATGATGAAWTGADIAEGDAAGLEDPGAVPAGLSNKERARVREGGPTDATSGADPWDGPRFGARLRALADGLTLFASADFLAVLRRIADEIDQDVRALRSDTETAIFRWLVQVAKREATPGTRPVDHPAFQLASRIAAGEWRR